MAVNRNGAGARADVAGQNVHGGAFARAVEAKQADDLSGRNRKRDALKRFFFPVALDEVFHLYQLCLRSFDANDLCFNGVPIGTERTE
ncbi:hypothetical protein SDC9_192527 [bioreactor metagenome]|uniref:Uncharacterized protein n=1 Tax=bioreactor metagenome TaxID=1076179 RepID=A0A645I1C9_9ZZZZ